MNASQSINEIGQILKDHCEQDNITYQSSIVEMEEKSRDVITKQVHTYIQHSISSQTCDH